MVLGSTQPLTGMSTRNISWGVKAAGAHGWQPCHFKVPTVLKSVTLRCRLSWNLSLNLLEHSEPVQACNGFALPLTFTEERGCVASATSRPHQIPDQRCSQFNDTKNFKLKVKLQTRRSGNRNAGVESIPRKFDVSCIKLWGRSPHNDDEWNNNDDYHIEVKGCRQEININFFLQYCVSNSWATASTSN